MEDNTLNEIQQVFQQVFEDSSLQISQETGVDDIDEWDSLKNVILIDALEKHFNIKFDIDEIMEFSTVGAIYNSIKAKCG